MKGVLRTVLKRLKICRPFDLSVSAANSTPERVFFFSEIIGPAAAGPAGPAPAPLFALRPKVRDHLKDLMEKDIIEKVDGPSPWVSPVVVTPKPNGDIRLCVDMRRANEAIIRERHPIPTIDEVLEQLNGSTVLSKIDLRWGFHQVELSEDSRSITTFALDENLYRYKRMMFGITSARIKR